MTCEKTLCATVNCGEPQDAHNPTKWATTWSAKMHNNHNTCRKYSSTHVLPHRRRCSIEDDCLALTMTLRERRKRHGHGRRAWQCVNSGDDA